MIIKKLTFQNFKSFGKNKENQTLENLGLLNLIYGENNSGKSNVLKLIDLIFSEKIDLDVPYDVEGEAIAKPGGKTSFYKGRILNDAFLFHNNDRSKDVTFDILIGLKEEEIKKIAGWELILHDYSKKSNAINLRIIGRISSLQNAYESEMVLDEALLNEKDIYKKTTERSPKFFQTSGNPELKGNSNIFEGLMNLLTDSVLFLDDNRYLIKEEENNSNQSLTINNYKNWLHQLSLNPIDRSIYEKLIQFIKDYSFPGEKGKALKNFNLAFGRQNFGKQNNEIDVFLKNGDVLLPIDSFGTGVRQTLYILSKIHETDSRILLIEELELNLSPKSQQELLEILARLIASKKIDQVIVTSHSDILAKTSDLSIYEVQMQANGVSKIEYKQTPDKVFFKRSSAIDKQMASVLRTPGIKGPEWD